MPQHDRGVHVLHRRARRLWGEPNLAMNSFVTDRIATIVAVGCARRSVAKPGSELVPDGQHPDDAHLG
jgi:hypothetical protein